MRHIHERIPREKDLLEVWGGQIKSKNRAKTCSEKRIFSADLFCRFFPQIICACFSAVRMADVAENGLPKFQHKNPVPQKDLIKNADQVVLQTQPFCLYEQRKGSRKKEIFSNSQLCTPLPKTLPLVRKALDTCNLLRHVMRATLLVRPKRSERSASLKQSPIKPVQILKKHTTKISTEQILYENEMV